MLRHLLFSTTSVVPPPPPPFPQHPSTAASFSTDSASSSSSSSSAGGSEFKHPKARATFDRIVNAGLSADDVLKLTESVNAMLGRPVRDNEFYYRAFGGAGGARGGGGGTATTEEAAAAPPAPTTADVKLVGFDAASKIKVIKEVRSILGLGLKEAKDLVEGAPKVLQKGISIAAAEELRDKLLAAGAQVELA